MEKFRLQRLRNLFRCIHTSQEPLIPLTQLPQEPQTHPLLHMSTQTGVDSDRPTQEPSHSQSFSDNRQNHAQQHPYQAVDQPVNQPVVTFFGLSDAGLKRSNNEDHFIVADLTRREILVEDNVILPDTSRQFVGYHGTLLAVADGLGGHDDGEIASHIAVEAIVQTLFTLQLQQLSEAERLTIATQEAHNAIRRYTGAISGSRSMSSTLTAVHIGQDTMTIAQVGDSRAYRFSNGVLTQLTEDQTIVQMMLKKGMLTEEEAQHHPDRHVILQAMGQERAISPEITPIPLQNDDCILLCSDGLSSYVDHQCIENILHAEPDEQTQCKRLLEAAYAAGGEDNVTILIAHLRPSLPW